jgi:PhoH-like ATPase
VESWQEAAATYYRISGHRASLLINQFVFFEAPGEPSLYARVTEIRGKTAVLKTLRTTATEERRLGRDRAQPRAELRDEPADGPEVDFVTLTGTAGTGKTLLALAAGLAQVLDDRRYTEIIMTRVTVSVGEDIGFLPGTEERWALDGRPGRQPGVPGQGRRRQCRRMGPRRHQRPDPQPHQDQELNFMRGRTFMNKFVIIDEAQNLTPKQMKTLITRAGPGTKIICMGNLAQIDTPYLTEGSSGLTYVVDRFKGWPHSGHITLARGERSRLADFASEVL